MKYQRRSCEHKTRRSQQQPGLIHFVLRRHHVSPSSPFSWIVLPPTRNTRKIIRRRARTLFWYVRLLPSVNVKFSRTSATVGDSWRQRATATFDSTKSTENVPLKFGHFQTIRIESDNFLTMLRSLFILYPEMYACMHTNKKFAL